jgi:hypothetical protein
MPILDKIRPARLDDIRRDDGSSLYVLNNLANNAQVRDGLIIFNVAIDANDRRIVRVPNTWVPVNIGLQIPKDLILRSPDFLDSVIRQIIILVKTEDAEQVIAEEPGAQEEWDRISQDIAGRYSLEPDTIKVTSDMGEIEGAIDPEINVQLGEICSRDDVSESELISVVRNLTERGQLKRKDYEFVLANTQFVRVREFATNQMARLPRQGIGGRTPRMA